jgi:hypothetical protein
VRLIFLCKSDIQRTIQRHALQAENSSRAEWVNPSELPPSHRCRLAWTVCIVPQPAKRRNASFVSGMLMTINFSERALFGHAAEDNKFVTRANDAILLKLGVLLWNGDQNCSFIKPYHNCPGTLHSRPRKQFCTYLEARIANFHYQKGPFYVMTD